MKKEWILYVVILCVAAFLRLYNLSSIPPGVNQDEASIGYTAYSLIKTGNDEYGRLLPLSFQSFGDWKLPFYIYTTVPFVQFFGLNELAVRLPSALFGIATVALMYFFVQELFQDKRLSFLAMTLLAIAPWSLHLSRVESESNTAVFFVTLGMFLFIKGLKKHKWFLVVSAFFIALTYFIYAGNYVFTTLLVIGTIVIYRSQIPKSKITVIAGLVFLIMSGFIGFQTVFANNTKISGIGIFGNPAVVHAEIEIPRNQHEDSHGFFPRIVHNKATYAAERFVQNYLNAYSPQFLFISGGTNNAHNINDFGNMYLVEAPFLLLGLFALFTRKKSSEKYLVLLWFFVAPIAASLTKDAPHTNRMAAILPILPLVVSFGLLFFWEKIKKLRLWGKLIVVVIVGGFALNFLVYIDRYYTHFPKNEVASWGFGYKELVRRLETNYKGMHVVMSQPQRSNYAYLLFYSKYDPQAYQNKAVRYQPTSDGFVHVKQYGNIEFRDIDFGKDAKLSNTVLVSFQNDTPYEVKVNSKTETITLPNGDVMFYIYNP